ncbi:MAG TPA: hypothetical protein ENI98_00460 [Gammaproteobacteria bacterium]|nr:hypothetical protein [Gammaproteobacteria bacterium]
MTISFSLKQLRGMIGVEVEYQGVACKVIEVLEDRPAIVLQCIDASCIQPNQHGDPNRRVPQTYTVPVLSDNQKEWHTEFLSLNLI